MVLLRSNLQAHGRPGCVDSGVNAGRCGEVESFVGYFRRRSVHAAEEAAFLESSEFVQPGAHRGRRGGQTCFELIEPTLAGGALQVEGFIQIWTDLAPEILERSVQGCDSGKSMDPFPKPLIARQPGNLTSNLGFPF
jgi:hypothetical protein